MMIPTFKPHRIFRRVHGQGQDLVNRKERKMKTLLLTVFAALLAGCATDQHAASSSSSSPAGHASPASVSQTETAKAQKTLDSGKSGSAESLDRPVEFTSLGVTSDKQSIAYRIKVNSTNPIDEVHLVLKEMDASGKIVDDTTIVWQNIVESTRQPIESGRTYEDKSTLDPGNAKAECSLREVVFKDGKRWSAH
jgi:hypothetical protein